MSNQPMQILFVDDEAIVRRAVKLLLQYDGHTVVVMDSGPAALAEMAQRRFDLVITDFSMPGMDGHQFVVEVRRLYPEQPVIMATAFADEYLGNEPLANNADAYLQKPFSLDEMRQAIKAVLNQPRPAGTSLPILTHEL